MTDAYFYRRSAFKLDDFFKLQMKKAETSLLKKIGHEREARKNRILNEAKEGDFNDLNEDNEDEEIIKKVREKIVMRKLFITTRFWYYWLYPGSSRNACLARSTRTWVPTLRSI